MDQFDVVRDYYRALNRADVEAVASLYDPQCVTENVFQDDGHLIVRGRDENRRRLAHLVSEFAPGHDDGGYFRVRTIGGIGTGWGWVQADWSRRLVVRATGHVLATHGYSHFLVEDGLIRRHRSVASSRSPEAPPRSPDSPRHYPERPVVGVGAVVMVSEADRAEIGWSEALPDPAIVLIKRRFEPLAGQWSLPGGMLEIGETLEAGVAREIAEETGLAVRVGPVVDVFDRILFDHDQRVRYHFVLIDYLCRPVAGNLQAGSDVSDVTLADPRDLAEFGLTAKAVNVIERAVGLTATLGRPREI
jgi:ADP-ribose pyrophosphatase YjhB (NUDIX family)/ketosteroid isomerase-like protein